ncbi:hypothetical protein BaRGS_00002291 [Batillaria attramentaria]|uniref:Uncharacterized protein n=1 Tax=Batillaria attramentaria TaxID=370345 RepID=A0ABD0M2P7_9CAEN
MSPCGIVLRLLIVSLIASVKAASTTAPTTVTTTAGPSTSAATTQSADTTSDSGATPTAATTSAASATAAPSTTGIMNTTTTTAPATSTTSPTNQTTTTLSSSIGSTTNSTPTQPNVTTTAPIPSTFSSSTEGHTGGTPTQAPNSTGSSANTTAPPSDASASSSLPGPANMTTVYTSIDSNFTDTSGSSDSPTQQTPTTTASLATGTGGQETSPPDGATGTTTVTSPTSSTPEVVTTTSSPPTTTPRPSNYPTQPVNTDGFLVWTISVGQGQTSDIVCSECNKSEILSKIRYALKDIPGFYDVRLGEPETARRRKRVAQDAEFTVEVLLHARDTISSHNSADKAKSALQALNTTVQNLTISGDALDNIITGFVNETSSLCNMDRACNTGYTCRGTGTDVKCYHNCDDQGWSCGEHGTCEVIVGTDGTATTSCRCESNDDTVYSGDRCQESEINPDKVVAIVAGVLGAACALFLLIIIWLCWKLRGTSSPSK